MPFASQTRINTAMTDKVRIVPIPGILSNSLSCHLACRLAYRFSAPALLHFPPLTRFEPQQLKVIAMASLRPEIVTISDLSKLTVSSVDHGALVAGLDQRFRMLRLVVERLPKHFTPYKHLPEYRLTYYVERLNCGHERIYYPQAGLMSKRRYCGECKKASSLPPKKDSQSVATEQERAA